MSPRIQIFILIFVLLILLFVFELLRRRKISEAVTLWWLFIGVVIAVLTVSKKLLLYITLTLGTALPMTTLILLSLLFILLMLVYFSMKISVLSDQLKDLTQYISILKNEYDDKFNKMK
ncbi:MAG: DUF2304 domain-containing protein [Candidatus Margulisbacteria bacterium]|nr:DUF2304 domain-containing protein [Candidatus Margulisiibacteriota bacterium]